MPATSNSGHPPSATSMSTTPVTAQPPGVRAAKNCSAWQLAWVNLGGTNAASTRGRIRPA